MGTSTYAKNSVLNYLLRGVASAPSAWYVALYSASPVDDEDAEQTGTGYARASVTFVAALNGVVRNSADLNFGTADSWDDVTHYAIFDASTAGNLLTYGTFDPTVSPVDDEDVIIKAGTLEISVE